MHGNLHHRGNGSAQVVPPHGTSTAYWIQHTCSPQDMPAKPSRFRVRSVTVHQVHAQDMATTTIWDALWDLAGHARYLSGEWISATAKAKQIVVSVRETWPEDETVVTKVRSVLTEGRDRAHSSPFRLVLGSPRCVWVGIQDCSSRSVS